MFGEKQGGNKMIYLLVRNVEKINLPIMISNFLIDEAKNAVLERLFTKHTSYLSLIL